MNHSGELLNLRGVMGTLWICNQSVISMGSLGTPCRLASEMDGLKPRESDVNCGYVVSELHCSITLVSE